MEVRIIKDGKTKKAQMMTTVVLLMFVLMLAELFAFLIINSNYNSLSNSEAMAAGAQSVQSSLSLGARDFAGQSLQRAIQALASYEYNPSLRGSNFVSNFSYYVSNLMIAGTLPNATSSAQNALSLQMGGLTLNSYNATVQRAFQLGSVFSINETRPYIYQSSPYTISVKYTENVRVNASSGAYSYGIPVNATLNLTGMPDLFYAQQGIKRYVSFANLSQQVSLIGNTYANNGSLYNFVYGTVNVVAPGGSCPNLGAAISNSIILVAQSGSSITSSGCENGFGGFITTSNTLSATPKVPYLGYPGSTGLAQYFRSGSSVLLYGPGFGAFGIEGLRNAMANGYYFPSIATASYMQRANGQLGQSSPQGIFTFSGFSRQGASFNGASSNIIVSNTPIVSGNNATFIIWADRTGNETGGPAGGFDIMLSEWGAYLAGCYKGNPMFSVGGETGGPSQKILTGGSCPPPGSWTQYVGTYNGNTMTLYLNGAAVNSIAQTGVIGTSATTIGGYALGSYNFNGTLANAQIYNRSLSAPQVAQLYRDGIEGLPLPNSGLVGWWPLNGNANDYSGKGNNGAASNVVYSLLPSGTPSATLPHFNGTDSYINIGHSSALDSGSTYTVVEWIKTSASGTQMVYSAWNGGSNGYQLYVSSDAATIWTGGGGAIVSSKTVNDGNWHQLAGTFNSGGTGTIYVDGKSVDSGSTSAITSSGNEQIGVQYNGAAYNLYFNGIISNVQVYSSILSAAQIKQLYQTGIGGGPIGNAGLVGWWPLNGNANDYSGSGNAGSPMNVAFNQSAGGVTDSLTGSSYYSLYPLPGVLSCYSIYNCYNASLHNIWLSSYPAIGKSFMQAGQFNGASSYIDAGTGQALNPSTALTVSGWVFESASGSGVDEDIANKWTYQTEGDWEMEVSAPPTIPVANSILVFTAASLTDSGANYCYSPQNSFDPGTWQHVSFVFNGLGGTNTARLQVYINGNQQSLTCGGTIPSSLEVASTAPVTIGYFPGVGRYWNGEMADLQIYNAALSANQINALYQEGLGGAPIAPGNVVGWWPLNGNANDYSGNRNDGVSDQNVAYPYISYNSSNVASVWQALGLGVYSK